MRLKIQSFIIIVLFFVTLMSCKKETVEFTDSPVIEAYIEPGNYLRVSVTRQIPFSSTVQYSADDINNLQITVAYNNLTHVLTPLGNGQYIDSLSAIAAGTHYDLSFTFNKKQVAAYTYIPTKPLSVTQTTTTIAITKQDSTTPKFTGTPPDPITFTWANPDASYYLIYVENIETGTLIPIRSFKNFTPPANRFRKQPVTLNTQDIRSNEFQYYGRHRIILYHVLPDYATLYDQTNTSSQNLTNPSTSITNGYGIFTGLNADTLYVLVKQP